MISAQYEYICVLYIFVRRRRENIVIILQNNYKSVMIIYIHDLTINILCKDKCQIEFRTIYIFIIDKTKCYAGDRNHGYDLPGRNIFFTGGTSKTLK